jgi:hypothetical protein
MQSQTISYEVQEGLLQAIVATLNEMPAGRVRSLLNAIEAECQRQDQARDQAEKDRMKRQWMEQGQRQGQGEPA